MSTISIHTAVRTNRRPVACTAAKAPVAVRLTRRGRLALFLVAATVVLTGAIAFGSSVTATGESGDPVSTTTTVVQPGQTLWQLAKKANPGGDIRQTVDDLMELNALPNASALQIGDEIALPVYN
ncbi:hypothetical protein BH09ACT10_BH09ACT10_06770 [soil metagenome]